MKHLIIILALFLTGCWDGAHYVEEHKEFRIDSVEYLPIGVPSVANLDPRWIAYTKFGKFTYYRPVKVGDSVEVIIMHRDTVKFDPIYEHSEIKPNEK
jgi:hypothetical protein